ncbi:MAG: DUF2961 domain-containing protein [Candidatus Brocadiia bacterium]
MRIRSVATWLVLGGLLAAPTARLDAAQRDLCHFLRTLVDLDRLPALERGVTCKQFSSYDRASRYDAEKDEYIGWRANGDRGHYLRIEPDGEAVMAEMDGPGCIVRIWSANPTGKLRLYLDGDETPTYEWNFADLFHDKVPPFTPPIAGMHGRGANSYLPIPYAKSCKVAADKAHSQYYHIGYKTFPRGTAVETFRLPLSDEERAALEAVAERWSQCEPDVPDAKVATRELSAGQETVLGEWEGPGTMVYFRAKLISGERHALRRVLLRIYWDGEQAASVECPLGDFFGTGYFANPYRSLPMGMGPDGGYSLWPMPFRKRARFVLVNQGKRPARVEYAIHVRRGELPPDTAYFHARWRREDPCTTFDYPILECSGGAGRYVGCVLNVDNPSTGWWGEGDEKVYVDGEKFPSTFGTGSEDYFGDAWGFRHFVHPLHGCTLGQGPGFSNKWSVYRWHISDDIPFEKSFRMTIENYGRDKAYSSVAYWYQLHPQDDFFESVAVAERLPRPMTLPGVVEAESLAVEGARVIDDEGRLEEFSGGKALLLEGGEGTTFGLPVPVPRDDVYAIVLYSARAEPQAAFEVLCDGERVGGGEDAFLRSNAFRAGKTRLEEGQAPLAVRLAAEGSLAVDAVKLEPSRKVRGAIEAEGLPVLDVTGPRPLREDIRLPWSGDSQLLFPAAADGQSLTLGLPVDAAGRHLLSARLSRGPRCGRVQALVGETPVGEEVDAYAPEARVGEEVPLGEAELGPEANAVTFRVTGRNAEGSGWHVGIDYLRLARIVVPGAIEAERLERVAVEGGPIGVQRMGAWGAHKWSGGRQLFFRAQDEGAYVGLEVEVDEAGRYGLAVYYTKAVDYGTVQLHLDGKPVGRPFDGFHRGVVPSGKVSYGAVELTQGAHRLKFVVVGKNEASTGHFVGIDCLTLRPAE